MSDKSVKDILTDIEDINNAVAVLKSRIVAEVGKQNKAVDAGKIAEIKKMLEGM